LNRLIAGALRTADEFLATLHVNSYFSDAYIGRLEDRRYFWTTRFDEITAAAAAAAAGHPIYCARAFARVIVNRDRRRDRDRVLINRNGSALFAGPADRAPFALKCRMQKNALALLRHYVVTRITIMITRRRGAVRQRARGVAYQIESQQITLHLMRDSFRLPEENHVIIKSLRRAARGYADASRPRGEERRNKRERGERGGRGERETRVS